MSLKNKKKNMKKGYAFLKTGNESSGKNSSRVRIIITLMTKTLLVIKDG